MVTWCKRVSVRQLHGLLLIPQLKVEIPMWHTPRGNLASAAAESNLPQRKETSNMLYSKCLDAALNK
eukprot:4332945-Pyramimonas_sp.AAC.1